jgi:hypothetical protein
VVTDMSKSRLTGFTGYRRTLDAFTCSTGTAQKS